MTIADNYKPIRQMGNGITTDFSFDFKSLNENYIRVYREKEGVQTLVDKNEYKVSVKSIGGMVIFKVAPTVGTYIVIARNVPLDQETPYKTSNGFPANRVEENLDKLTAISQQIADNIERSPRLPIGTVGIELNLPAPDVGKALVWNQQATALVNSKVNVDNLVDQVAGDAAAAAASAMVASDKAYEAQDSAQHASISEQQSNYYATDSKKWAIGNSTERPEGSAKYWAEKINPYYFFPVGMVIMHPLSTLDGYIPCNGAAISRTTYTDLFRAIGTTYGNGNGSTTFNVPDFRGDFIRGYLSGTSATIGTRQNEGLPNISGGPFVLTIASSSSVPTPYGAAVYNARGYGLAGGTQTYVYEGGFDARLVTPIYGSSTHVTPRNNALNFFIKY